MNQRITYIDFGSGIMILWMIFQHAVQSAWAIDPSLPGEIFAENPNTWFPYLNFFMPWFFYKSGAFFQKRSVKELWKKDNQKFLQTFIIWSLIGYAAYIILGVYDHNLTLRDALYTPTRRFFFSGYIAINAPLWFLLTLYGVRFLANISLPQSGDPYKHIKCALIVLLGVSVAFVSHLFYHPLLPLWVANSTAGLSFFVLGYWLHNYERRMWLLIPCILGYICSCVFGWNSVCMHTNELLDGYYLLWFPAALCGIVCFNYTSRTVCDALDNFAPPTIRIRFLELVGKCAMPIFATHAFIRYPIHAILIHTNQLFPWGYTLAIICAGYAILLPIICLLWHRFTKS